MHAFHAPLWIYLAFWLSMALMAAGVAVVAFDPTPRTWTRVMAFALWEFAWLVLALMSAGLIWMLGGSP